MGEFINFIATVLLYTILGIISAAFLFWQVKRLRKGKFSIFTILYYILKYTAIFILAFISGMLDEMFTPTPEPKKKKYLDTTSALTMGMSLEDVYKYNLGDPVVKLKIHDIEPYIEKTEYF